MHSQSYFSTKSAWLLLPHFEQLICHLSSFVNVLLGALLLLFILFITIEQ